MLSAEEMMNGAIWCCPTNLIILQNSLLRNNNHQTPLTW